ncbi:MAG TPA: hypothetical protein DCY55_06185 [Gammaproteobacteria bacterium]|nr:hypothetical protein [Gammaproteobacteria bacterium]
MSRKRYPAEFKIAAVKQVTEADVVPMKWPTGSGPRQAAFITGSERKARGRGIIERSRKSQMRFVD